MTHDSFIQQKETHRQKKAGRGSEAVYNYLLLGVPRSTRPPHYFVKICDHENIARTNHPLPLIPVEQLSADGAQTKISIKCRKIQQIFPKLYRCLLYVVFHKSEPQNAKLVDVKRNLH